jgi:hypothetical protein
MPKTRVKRRRGRKTIRGGIKDFRQFTSKSLEGNTVPLDPSLVEPPSPVGPNLYFDSLNEDRRYESIERQRNEYLKSANNELEHILFQPSTENVLPLISDFETKHGSSRIILATFTGMLLPLYQFGCDVMGDTSRLYIHDRNSSIVCITAIYALIQNLFSVDIANTTPTVLDDILNGRFLFFAYLLNLLQICMIHIMLLGTKENLRDHIYKINFLREWVQILKNRFYENPPPESLVPFLTTHAVTPSLLIRYVCTDILKISGAILSNYSKEMDDPYKWLTRYHKYLEKIDNDPDPDRHSIAPPYLYIEDEHSHDLTVLLKADEEQINQRSDKTKEIINAKISTYNARYPDLATMDPEEDAFRKEVEAKGYPKRVAKPTKGGGKTRRPTRRRRSTIKR